MMSCHRNSPSSPRAPKIQQQSWDDCDSPPIDLYDPCQINSPKSPSRISGKAPPPPLKNPKSPRNFNNSNYYEPRSPSISSRSFNLNNDPQRSPKITTTYHAQDEDDDSTSGSSFYQTPTSGSRSPKSGNTSAGGGSNYYYESHQSPRRSPNSPRKFVFDAISPSFDQKCKKFEYSEPFSPDDDIMDDDGQLSQSAQVRAGYITKSSQGHYHARHDSVKSYTSRTSGSNQQNAGVKPTLVAELMQQSSCGNINGSGAVGGAGSGGGGGYNNGCDLNEQSGGMINNYMISNGNRYHHQQQHNMQQQHQHQQHQQQQSRHLDEFSTIAPMRNMYLKRDSCMTESTQLSGDSCETSDTALTATTTLSYEPPRIQGNNGGNGCDGNDPFRNDDDNMHSGRRGGISRRHAINITPNPGYQVLHSSHSTLDRTCSDSVVSLRCRKSTSDLTSSLDETSNSSAKNGGSSSGGNGPVQAINKPIRRRGSSKSGLAYLASRRSSRDSIKSAVSNTSVFSNEDVGPLAFQSSTRGRQRRTSNFLELPIPDHIRPRVCSLPDRPYNPRVSDDLYRLRHFSISKGTVVNCGDSIISRRSRSNTSVNSTNSRASERSPFEGSCCGGGYANVDSMPPSPSSNDSNEPPPPPRYRIVMLGDAGVGKTALVSQFMTSEYMHTYDASLDDEFGEKTVSVLLDDEESELVFIDHPSVEMSVENSLSTYEPHGCVVIYSVVDRNSFRIAEETVNYLWKENMTKEKSVILVGNKADLARARVITTHEGKALAASRDVKFIETSSGIQHNVDELLVGVLKQIRLKAKRDKKAESKMKTSRTHMSLHLAKEILQKICLSDITKSKSCENLHVL